MLSLDLLFVLVFVQCICLFNLHALIPVIFLFLLVSGVYCSLCSWYSLDFCILCVSGHNGNMNDR